MESQPQFTIMWPEVFETGQLPKEYTNKSLIADAYVGWGNCYMGQGIPKEFGNGMAAISRAVGHAVTEKALKEHHHLYI